MAFSPLRSCRFGPNGRASGLTHALGDKVPGLAPRGALRRYGPPVARSEDGCCLVFPWLRIFLWRSYGVPISAFSGGVFQMRPLASCRIGGGWCWPLPASFTLLCSLVLREFRGLDSPPGSKPSARQTAGSQHAALGASVIPAAGVCKTGGSAGTKDVLGPTAGVFSPRGGCSLTSRS